MVTTSWQAPKTGRKMFQVVGKLHRLKGLLLKLNKERFYEVEKKADSARDILMKYQMQLQNDPRNSELIKKEAAATIEYKYWKLACEKFLQQKCKVKWLQEGDLNTRFFHTQLKARRNTNKFFFCKRHGWG